MHVLYYVINLSKGDKNSENTSACDELGPVLTKGLPPLLWRASEVRDPPPQSGVATRRRGVERERRARRSAARRDVDEDAKENILRSARVVAAVHRARGIRTGGANT